MTLLEENIFKSRFVLRLDTIMQEGQYINFLTGMWEMAHGFAVVVCLCACIAWGGHGCPGTMGCPSLLSPLLVQIFITFSHLQIT